MILRRELPENNAESAIGYILAIERDTAAAALPDVAELAAALYSSGLYADEGHADHPSVTEWDDLTVAVREAWAGDAAAILAEIERARG